MRTQFGLRFWGKHQDRALKMLPASVPVEREDGDGDFCAWFANARSREEYLSRITAATNYITDLKRMDINGPTAKYYVFAEVQLAYAGKLYKFVDTYGFGYPYTAVDFLWHDGNCACDCNLSDMIARHCDQNFPEMPCGKQIELMDLTVDGDEPEFIDARSQISKEQKKNPG